MVDLSIGKEAVLANPRNYLGQVGASFYGAGFGPGKTLAFSFGSDSDIHYSRWFFYTGFSSDSISNSTSDVTNTGGTGDGNKIIIKSHQDANYVDWFQILVRLNSDATVSEGAEIIGYDISRKSTTNHNNIMISISNDGKNVYVFENGILAAKMEILF